MTAVPCQQFLAQIAKNLICQCAMISNEPAVLLDLWLTLHTLRVVKKSLLSPLTLFIESSPGSEKGGSGQQMTPELLNETFSAKATRQKP
jgi:hypothetical protein